MTFTHTLCICLVQSIPSCSTFICLYLYPGWQWQSFGEEFGRHAWQRGREPHHKVVTSSVVGFWWHQAEARYYSSFPSTLHT